MCKCILVNCVNDCKIGMMVLYAVCTAFISIYPFNVLFDSSFKWEFSHYFDDKYNFFEFPELNSLVPKHLPSASTIENIPFILNHLLKIITHRGINVYEPVGGLYKALIIDLVGLDARALRQVSYFGHVFNGILLYVWISMLFSNSFARSSHYVSQYQHTITLIMCGIFIVHPLNMEVIGWLSAHTYIPALSFALLSSICLEKLWSECSLPPQLRSSKKRFFYLTVSLIAYLAGVWVSLIFSPIFHFKLMIMCDVV